MMKIAVVGLGLIGGSMAAALKTCGKYIVGGKNRNHGVTEYALEHGLIDEEAVSLLEYDVVFVALPPRVTAKFLDETTFRDDTIVADICGVKGFIESAVYSKPRNYRYVGTHPMAGKEVSGIHNATANLFQGANMVLVRHEKTDPKAYEIVRALTKDMGFGYIVECDSSFHDKKIALTSQLAHIVSNAYIKSPTIEGYRGFTGGSFQDMTRIAGVDESIWSELYFANLPNIREELDGLIAALKQYSEAFAEVDEERMKELLREGRIIKERFKELS